LLNSVNKEKEVRYHFSNKSPNYFILILVVNIMGNLFTGGLSQLARGAQVFNWDKAMVAYDAYIDYPSRDNAKALLAALPMDRPDEESGDRWRALEHIFSADSYPILYEETTSGDRISIEILFRLLNVTDGHYTELILSTLGWIVRNRPQVFLEVLTLYKDSGSVRKHGYPLSFSGPGYNMHKRAYRYHLERSIEALETVRDQKYATIKEACINRLRQAIKSLAKQVN
jgi:hypothetical protein